MEDLDPATESTLAPIDSDLERARFELERKRIFGELSLKNRELEIRAREVGSHTITPLTATVIAGLVGLLGTGVGAYIQGRANRELERQKFEAQLITRAVEVDDHDAAARNLSFLVQAGLLSDEGGRIAALIKNPKSIPIQNVVGDSLIDVSDATFDEEVLQSKTPTVVLFTAPWAGPSRRSEQQLLQLAASTTKVKIRRLNVDASPALARRYEIRMLPTFILFAGGAPKKTVYGAVAGEELQDFLSKAPSAADEN